MAAAMHQAVHFRHQQGTAGDGESHALQRAQLPRSNAVLRCHDSLIALAAQKLPQHPFRVSVSITPRRIEERDPRVPGDIHRAQRGGAAHAPQHRSASEAQHGCLYFAAYILPHELYSIAQILSGFLAAPAPFARIVHKNADAVSEG